MDKQEETYMKYERKIRSTQEAQEENHLVRRHLESERAEFEAELARAHNWAVSFEEIVPHTAQGRAMADEVLQIVSYTEKQQDTAFDEALTENAKQRDQLERQTEELIEQRRKEMRKYDRGDRS